jgi:hypothetical protein
MPSVNEAIVAQGREGQPDSDALAASSDGGIPPSDGNAIP